MFQRRSEIRFLWTLFRAQYSIDRRSVSSVFLRIGWEEETKLRKFFTRTALLLLLVRLRMRVVVKLLQSSINCGVNLRALVTDRESFFCVFKKKIRSLWLMALSH